MGRSCSCLCCRFVFKAAAQYGTIGKGKSRSQPAQDEALVKHQPSIALLNMAMPPVLHHDLSAVTGQSQLPRDLACLSLRERLSQFCPGSSTSAAVPKLNGNRAFLVQLSCAACVQIVYFQQAAGMNNATSNPPAMPLNTTQTAPRP